MSRPQLLVHRTDEEVDLELEQALLSFGAIPPVLHTSDSLRQTIAAADSFQPNIFMVDLADGLENARVLIDEVVAVCPSVTVVGICTIGGGDDEDDSSLMLSALRIGVEDFIRRPISSIDLKGLFARRVENRREKKTSPGVLVSFISNKGGVGKSTCAVNVAVELASRFPDRVLLVDASLQMGVCATHLNLEPQTGIADAWNQRERLDQQLFQQLTIEHETGLHLMAAPRDAVESAEIDDAFISRILLLARRSYDYVVVDTFPLFDSTIMAVLDLSDIAYVVTDNVVPTLKSIRGFFDLLNEVGFSEERTRVLINRYSTKSGGPSLNDLERYLGRSHDYLIPLDNKIVLSANLGQPIMMSKPRWNKAVNGFNEISDAVVQFRSGLEESDSFQGNSPLMSGGSPVNEDAVFDPSLPRLSGESP